MTDIEELDIKKVVKKINWKAFVFVTVLLLILYSFVWSEMQHERESYDQRLKQLKLNCYTGETYINGTYSRNFSLDTNIVCDVGGCHYSTPADIQKQLNGSFNYG